MKILVINGPNLNLLGIREPDIYGIETLEDIQHWLDRQPDANGHDITWFQSNHEGDLIDQIQTTTPRPIENTNTYKIIKGRNNP